MINDISNYPDLTFGNDYDVSGEYEEYAEAKKYEHYIIVNGLVLFTSPAS